MLKKNLLYLLGALMFILWAGQPVQTQSTPEIPLKKQTCGDLWPVKQDKKWGYIDKTGQIIIPFKFDGAHDFSEGLAAVNIEEKTGYIDKTGKFVIQPRFISGFSFSEGLAVVLIRRIGQEATPNRVSCSIARASRSPRSRSQATGRSSTESFMRHAMSTPTAKGITARSVASTPPIGRP